jgi:hypothetical protein
MAGDWIKMRKSLLTDPRVVRISSALDADRFRTIGGLFSAWCLFDEQTSDGVLDGYTPEVFDDIIGIRGLARAMEMVGWLEITPEKLVATAFSQHNGQTAKRRAQEAVRKMSARDADKKADRKRTESAIEKSREDTNTNAERVAGWWDDQAFSRTWAQWRNHLFALGKPLTAYSEDIQLNSLTSIAGTVAERIAIVEHTIERGARNLIIDGGHRKDRPQPRVSRVATQEDLDNYDPNGNYD